MSTNSEKLCCFASDAHVHTPAQKMTILNHHRLNVWWHLLPGPTSYRTIKTVASISDFLLYNSSHLHGDGSGYAGMSHVGLNCVFQQMQENAAATLVADWGSIETVLPT